MKFIVAFSCIILVSFAAVSCCNRTPAGNTPVSPQEKPGTCYRPRYRRSLIEDTEEKHIVKRQGGFQGGNGLIGGGNNNGNNGGSQGGNLKPTPAPRPQCYKDYDCSGNKKCCSGICQTPSFTG